MSLNSQGTIEKNADGQTTTKIEMFNLQHHYINDWSILTTQKFKKHLRSSLVIVISCRKNKSKNRKHMSLIGSKLNICREHSNSSKITWLT